MVRWYHGIFTAYGFWLPNDPRGSWSTFVGSWELYKFGGAATKTEERRSVAHAAHDGEMRRQTKQHLKYPAVRFDEKQRECIAGGIEKACAESGIGMLACAIGFDHVHGVIERSAKSIERVIGQFKGRATQAMREAGCHPLAEFALEGKAPPTPWAENSWSVFINDEKQLAAAVDYVKRHPMKEGLPPQHWSFVKSM
jgi:REP element-mobilizing transposase RayT